MATYWENSCSFGLRYVSWYKYLIVSLVFSHLGFWSGNLFLIAPFPDLCLLVPHMKTPLREQITTGILKGVSYLHSKLIVHLDITPENILLTADGIPKLTNFGHARRVRDRGGQQNSGTASRGRIPFICPEVLAQKPVNNLTAVDAWAVGVVMYYIFTGGLLPIEGDTAKEVYNNHIQGAVWVPHRVRSKMINDDSFTKCFS